MANNHFIRRLIFTSLIFLIAGPVVGFLLFALFITLLSFNISALLIVIFVPAYLMAILIGGVPALITGICFAVLREKSADKFTVVTMTLIICFIVQSSFIFLIMGHDLTTMISMAVLGVFSALIIIFLTGYLKDNCF